MEPITVIVWTFVVVFVMTAIITIGGIVDNIKFIQVQDEYLKGLYIALLLEVVGASIAVAAGALDQAVEKTEAQPDLASPLSHNNYLVQYKKLQILQ